jgi:hypothetical protein
MNVNVGYNVLLPPEYDGSTRFPVIYMFGGGGSDENTYLVSGVEAGFNPDRSGFIIVYGNGSRDGKYYDAAPGSPLDGHQMVETTIILDPSHRPHFPNDSLTRGPCDHGSFGGRPRKPTVGL